MDSRVRADEIAKTKKRNSQRSGAFVSYHIKRLKKQFEENYKTHLGLSDFYLIRSVTYLEVLTRSEIALIVDMSREYTDRAVELTKNFKMDLTTVQDIQGRAITLGDVVANSIPVNRFHQIISHFEVLLDTKLRPLLVNAVDRWRTEIEMQPPEPIIRDYDRMAGRLTRLFEVRHILCHELPSRAVYSAEEAGEFLDEAASFAQALEEVLTFRKYGRVPLTQTEMNIQAHEDLNRKTEELDGLLSNIREYIDDSDKRFFSLLPDFVKQTQLECFNDLQEKWVAYRNAQADFETHENLGGTIRPTLWSSIATQITKERIAHLRNWYEARLERSGYKDS